MTKLDHIIDICRSTAPKKSCKECECTIEECLQCLKETFQDEYIKN